MFTIITLYIQVLTVYDIGTTLKYKKSQERNTNKLDLVIIILISRNFFLPSTIAFDSRLTRK